jgi:hypothetical protein
MKAGRTGFLIIGSHAASKACAFCSIQSVECEGNFHPPFPGFAEERICLSHFIIQSVECEGNFHPPFPGFAEKDLPVTFCHVTGLIESGSTPAHSIGSRIFPHGRSPIEQEQQLDIASYLRFHSSGALCCAGDVTPVDAVKTKVQRRNP